MDQDLCTDEEAYAKLEKQKRLREITIYRQNTVYQCISNETRLQLAINAALRRWMIGQMSEEYIPEMLSTQLMIQISTIRHG